ncbi:hypothetical protein BDV26DRAFT_286982 [Aspergillus bertholletiae]|uniref:P-loop containing nucleoside triphosphate hydrolase protein n=1 Tax=Aspergillus bertholletiae TaxID=1226010 RepID=A0A5N7AQL0_9EURO|nr:hypothetical protein BDV26DRAFT_286982 [Aspergillus bertholletiae]
MDLSHTPIVSSDFLTYQLKQETATISQFGLLAGSGADSQKPDQTACHRVKSDPRLYFNVSHPSSTFICGSQGPGKSHTLSSGRLPSPLTGLVFHYDTFVGDTVENPCEAAFLSSHPDVQVRVLCSPTNLNVIQDCYSKFNILVDVLQLDQTHLNTKRMMDLMAMRIAQQDTKGSFNYQTFKRNVIYGNLTRAQQGPLKQRLATLESFTALERMSPGRRKSQDEAQPGNQCFQAGHLTIIDLSCPCISPETACSKRSIGRVIALDEAHKYMNMSPEARAFAETLRAVARFQRHLATRVVISTQEPIVATDLLNICSVTIVHRFASPEWFQALQKHLAAAAAPSLHTKVDDNRDQSASSLLDSIVQLGVGEAFIFAPSAIVKVSAGPEGRVELSPLGSAALPIKVRVRITSDGGRSALLL